MGNLKMGVIGIGVIFLISIIGAVIWTVYDMTDPEYKQDYRKIEEKNQAEKLVRNYQGIDNQGDSIENVIYTLMLISYPDAIEQVEKEEIVNYWDVIKSSPNDEDSIYEVSYYFSSPKEEFTYLWNVDMDTNEIIPQNQGAKDLINAVNTFE
ncbi:hypothetical protein [Nitrosopumilus sp.]|uniref:hypothetical protein n=1 Tax=Nitrosopumilus sp. TaxID=2024843 RepID=UPI00247D9D69|nr:hypothetical protein [Nitrosopumilus sp.]MCV0410765.1 hypothetical protein [Nitrosopumilus sp.]